MLSFDFMRHALVAGTFIAVICGMMGVFVIARSMSFLTHTLAEIGFAGAAFGLFMGWPALNGMLLFTVLSSAMVGELGVRSARRENVISAVSALFLGLGILFISLSDNSAASATSILFGSVIGISLSEVWQVVILSIIVILVTLLMYRQLKFDSFDSVGARVNGINGTVISIAFLIMLALSVSVAAQIVGSLLIFILLTLPAASARYFVHSVSSMIGLSIGFAVAGTWLGITLGYFTNWPTSFFIATIEVIFYLSGLIWNKKR